MVQDLATQWLQSYACKTKTSQETKKSLQKFLEPTRKPKVIHTDNSLEFGKACEDLSCTHCTSTPHKSETNVIAERAVRRIKEGTSAVLLQSGLDEKRWADSMECFCVLRNIQDLLSDGKTPYEWRIGEPNTGAVIPFGAMVEYHPYFCQRPVATASIRSKSLARYIPWICVARGEIHWGTGTDGRIWNLREMTQCKGSVDAHERWKVYIPNRRWKGKPPCIPI